MKTSWGAGLLALGQANKGLAAVFCERKEAKESVLIRSSVTSSFM